jgi:uncharacterized protein
MMALTAIHAGILGLIYLVLTARVIIHRRDTKISIGAGDDRDLEYKVRTHGNFVETVPIALILMGLAEVGGTSPWLIHLSGVALILGRLAHAAAFWRRPQNLLLRSVGMALTLLVIGLLSLVCLVPAL